MPKIKMNHPSKNLTLERAFQEFKVSQAAKGIKDKTLETYGFHFHAASKHLDMSLTFDELTKHDLDQMIVSMRKSGLHISTIFSSSRILLLVFAELSIACR